MRPTLISVAFLSVAAFIGCSGDCPGDSLEVREYEGPGVSSTAITCTGGDALSWPACEEPNISGIVREPAPDGCDAVRIQVGGWAPTNRIVVLWLAGDEEVDHAHVTAYEDCDDEPCSRDTPELLGGFVAPDAFSHDGENSGEFELSFAAGTIAGSYHAVPEI